MTALINPKTRAVSLDPFEWHGQSLRVIGTFRVGSGMDERWEHEVLNEETREVKKKSHEWIVAVNDKLNQIKPNK